MRLSRRSLLGSVGAASISPALPALARDSAAPAAEFPATTPAFEGRLLLGPQKRLTQFPARYAAAVLGGEFSGTVLAGVVQTGRVEWTVDADSQSMQISAQYAVLRQDGELVEVRDRSVHPRAVKPASIARLQTAPEIGSAGGLQEPPLLLVGLLDASGFSKGQVTLRAFRVV
jgi:hypothetical protein